MKCLRCGKDAQEGIKYCENCGFDLEKQKEYKTIYKEKDPIVEKNQKTNLIDAPVLTFVFGIISIMCSLVIASQGKPLPILFLIIYGICFSTCFILSTKKAKVKLKPFREVGVVIAFISLAIVLITLIKVIFF